jgi:ethanolamine utilization protein EutA
LTEPLARSPTPGFVTFSGGVAEYIFGRKPADHGDIARLLAAEIVAQLKPRLTIPVIEPSERIRATVIGASQFTVQVSGKTIYLRTRACCRCTTCRWFISASIFRATSIPNRLPLRSHTARASSI